MNNIHKSQTGLTKPQIALLTIAINNQHVNNFVTPGAKQTMVKRLATAGYVTWQYNKNTDGLIYQVVATQTVVESYPFGDSVTLTPKKENHAEN